jgi:hypothetical protein
LLVGMGVELGVCSRVRAQLEVFKYMVIRNKFQLRERTLDKEEESYVMRNFIIYTYEITLLL